ncbi:hypothetical protein HDV05_000937 [Chytridiales sp. JEL 0842]|nr:hypothetical protein HDV05_000937 [Chytridiales sp. JEL 0842]
MTDFHGPRSDRFAKLPPLTSPEVGPGTYNIDEATNLSKKIQLTPSSTLGVCLTTAIRFPELKEVAPSPNTYEPQTFIALLDSQITSRREFLGSLEAKSILDKMTRKADNPGPGKLSLSLSFSYIGKEGENGLILGMLLSVCRNRDIQNKHQLHELRTLLNSNDLFTDKRACRRMAHLALYFPS